MKELIAAIVCAAACVAQAQDSLVLVERPWARATVQGQTSSGAYMTLTAREPLTLVGAESPMAGVVEVHQMQMVGDVMRMSPVENLALKPGQPLQFAPNGYHFMLMQLKAPLRPGTAIPLKLHLRDARGAPRVVEVSAAVALHQGPAHHGGHK